MKKTIQLILLLILLVALVPAIAYADDEGVLPSSHLWRVSDNYSVDWVLGQEITPLPNYGDCDDRTLYSYLYLKSMPIEYDIKIMYGEAPFNHRKMHVWLVVSGDAKTYIYDEGIALSYEPFRTIFKGREISLIRLLKEVRRDLR